MDKEEDVTLITELLENLHYIDSAIGGEQGEEYCDEEILEIRITGKAIKDIKASINKAETRLRSCGG